MKSRVIIIGHIVAVLRDVVTGVMRRFESHNILCNDGDKFFAQLVAQESPTYDFWSGGMALGTGTTTPTKSDTDLESEISNSYKTIQNGYPKTNDTDPDNGGGGVDKTTVYYFWDTLEVVQTGIAECGVKSNNAAPPDALMNHGLFVGGPFNKNDTEQLKVFINFEIDGQ